MEHQQPLFDPLYFYPPEYEFPSRAQMTRLGYSLPLSRFELVRVRIPRQTPDRFRNLRWPSTLDRYNLPFPVDFTYHGRGVPLYDLVWHGNEPAYLEILGLQWYALAHITCPIWLHISVRSLISSPMRLTHLTHMSCLFSSGQATVSMSTPCSSAMTGPTALSPSRWRGSTTHSYRYAPLASCLSCTFPDSVSDPQHARNWDFTNDGGEDPAWRIDFGVYPPFSLTNLRLVSLRWINANIFQAEVDYVVDASEIVLEPLAHDEDIIACINAVQGLQ